MKTAQDALSAMHGNYREEVIPFVEFLYVDEAVFNAELEAAETAANKLAAYKSRCSRLLSFEQQIHALNEAGSRGGEANGYFTVKTARETADIELLKAEIANAISNSKE